MPLVLSGDGAVGPLSATEVSYLDGVTSAVQAQIDGKLATPGAWSSYTPTWTNLSVGNGTVTARYTQIGKTVAFSLRLVLGSTSTVTGRIQFTLPVTGSTTFPQFTWFANGQMLDATPGVAYATSASISSDKTFVYVDALGVGGTYASATPTSGTVPFTWTTSDEITVSGVYEAA